MDDQQLRRFRVRVARIASGATIVAAIALWTSIYFGWFGWEAPLGIATFVALTIAIVNIIAVYAKRS